MTSQKIKVGTSSVESESGKIIRPIWEPLSNPISWPSLPLSLYVFMCTTTTHTHTHRLLCSFVYRAFSPLWGVERLLFLQVGYQLLFFVITALLRFDKVTDFAGIFLWVHSYLLTLHEIVEYHNWIARTSFLAMMLVVWVLGNIRGA